MRRHDEQPRTMAEKVWADHVVATGAGEGDAREPDLIYIDLHLVHEVTSPQAFDGLRLAGRPVRRPDLTIATEDHNVPTIDIDKPIADPVSRTQVETLRRNCEEFGIRLHPMGDVEQGIVHIIGPQLGLTQPGTTVVCGDSHTSTHGAFGALAMGIGTSEVEHVLATQTLPLRPFKTMAINVDGVLPAGVSAKDIILAVIAKIGTGGGQGYVIEYRGSAIESLSMEGRMTICNMSIEAGARAGMVAPDETTFEYLRGRPHAPTGADWDAAVAGVEPVAHRRGCRIRHRGVHRRRDAEPVRHLGDQPRAGCAAGGFGARPRADVRRGRAPVGREGVDLHGSSSRAPRCATSPSTRSSSAPAPTAASRICGWSPTSCAAARSPTAMRMLVVPGSMRVRAQAESEGLGEIFTAAGAEWRQAGCSMCLGMNPDQLAPGERCASTSNRNFEGRQGKGGRTHLVSPAVAAATAVRGTLSSPADLPTATNR